MEYVLCDGFECRNPFDITPKAELLNEWVPFCWWCDNVWRKMVKLETEPDRSMTERYTNERDRLQWGV